MGLLRADLQALANGLRAEGRSALFGRLLPPAILAAMHWTIGTVMLEHRGLLQLVHRGGDPFDYLLAHALSPGPVVAGWIGFAQAQRQLFEAPELPLWHAAPGWPGRAAMQVLLRAVASGTMWTTALAAPLLVLLLHAAHAPAGAFAAIPLAMVAVVAPALCVAIGAQILLLRLSRGPATRLLTSLAGSLATFGFPVFLLAQVFTGSQSGTNELAAAAQTSSGAGPATRAAAAMLREAAAGRLSGGAILAVTVPIAIALAFALGTAGLHARAVENYQLARRPRPLRSRRWPAPTTAVLRRKEWAQLLQQPGALLHMVLVGALVHVFAAQGTLVRGLLADDAMPLPIQQCAAMLTLWFVAVLMLLYSHMGRLATGDGNQWPLFVQSPLVPGTLLAAKLQVIAALLLWPMVVAAWAGAQWFGADRDALLPFCGFAFAGNLVALAVVAALGTWPWLLRQEQDGRLTQQSRGLVGSILLVFTFYFALSPAFAAWLWLLHRHHARLTTDRVPTPAEWAPPILFAALGFASLLLAAALLLATRNYRRLLAPR